MSTITTIAHMNMGSFFKRKEECEKYYKLGRILGQGSFATVRMGICKADGKKWAVKIIRRASLAPDDEESLATEINILQRVNHPNIVHLKEVYDCKTNVYLVMEVMLGGELFDRIVHKEHYTEQEAKTAFSQIMSSVNYCHEINIVHRDLKPENLLYATTAEDSPLKLADFGLAYLLKRDELMHSSCGTPGYVAPEILKSGRGGAGYGKEVDMWSVGVILYILLCGFPPFYDEDNVRLFAAIQRGKYDFPSPYWDNVSAEAIDLIRKLLTVDPVQRYSAKQTLAHRWLTKGTGNSVHLSHFKDNMKAFNARRRLRHAIRTVQFLHMIKGFKSSGSAGNGSLYDSGLAVSDSNDHLSTELDLQAGEGILGGEEGAAVPAPLPMILEESSTFDGESSLSPSGFVSKQTPSPLPVVKHEVVVGDGVLNNSDSEAGLPRESLVAPLPVAVAVLAANGRQSPRAGGGAVTAHIVAGAVKAAAVSPRLPGAVPATNGHI